MLSASRGSSAYKLQPTEIPKRQNKPNRQQGKAKNKKQAITMRYKLIALVAVVFLVQLYVCSRWVKLYGLHDEIEQKTIELSNLQRDNEQKALAIESMTDSSRVEQYAKSELGMRKIEPSQIVYVQPVQGDSMQKVAKKDGSSKRGFFGAISATLGNAVEYLR